VTFADPYEEEVDEDVEVEEEEVDDFEFEDDEVYE
jgi:hypothetical protein